MTEELFEDNERDMISLKFKLGDTHYLSGGLQTGGRGGGPVYKKVIVEQIIRAVGVACEYEAHPYTSARLVGGA